MEPSSDLRYVVENVEEEIEEWCSLEYEHICQAVGGDRIIFTNVLDADLACIRKTYSPKIFSASIGSLRGEFDWSTAVLLDMDAEEQLRPQDAKDFRLCVFGGILGNVPSDDRTAEVRKHGFLHSRNLGSEQMTTNTAVLVAKIILQDQVPLSEIPFVDDPEIPVGDTGRETICLPFRYVAKSYFTHQSSDKDTPVLPERMLEYLRASGDLSLC